MVRHLCPNPSLEKYATTNDHNAKINDADAKKLVAVRT